MSLDIDNNDDEHDEDDDYDEDNAETAYSDYANAVDVVFHYVYGHHSNMVF